MFDSRSGIAAADGDPFVDDLFDEVVDGSAGCLGGVDLWGVDAWAEPSRLPPSGLVLDMLDTRPTAALGDFAAVETMVACERVIARATAVQAGAVAQLAALRGDGDGDGRREVADEVAAALRLSSVAADHRVAFGVDLAGRLPGTRAALHAGDITAVKARAIWEATLPLDGTAARRVEDHVLRRAADQTPAQLRACLRRAVLKADPDGARRRHETRRRERRVERDSLDDGMGSLWAYLTAVETCAAYTRLTDIARACKAAGDARGIDELRADALVAACLGRDPLAAATGTARAGAGTRTAGTNTTGTAGFDGTDATGETGTGEGRSGAGGVAADTAGTVGETAAAGPAGSGGGNRAGAGAGPGGGIAVRLGVTVGAGTLLGLDDEPAELAGYGPIPADMARALAADATWHRLLTDPATGALLDYGRRAHRPPANLADFVRARDRTCRFPGCQQPAWRGDLDHVVAWPTGPTADYNMGPLCRRHHQLKHHPDWSVTRNRDGSWTWTAPTGHTYTTPAEALGPVPEERDRHPRRGHDGHDPPGTYDDPPTAYRDSRDGRGDPRGS